MLSTILKPLGIASTLALSTLGLISRKSRRARFIYHLTLYAGTLGIMSVWGVVVSVAATLIGQRFNINYIVARSFYGTVSPLIGIRLRVEGEEHLIKLAQGKGAGGRPQSAVLVGNHQSFLDILYLGRIFPRRASIMAKRELLYAPLLGQYLAASGAVFINRKSKTHALAAMAKAGESMKRRGISLWVFPEGTRSSKPEPTLLPFKKGAFHLAVQAQVPIIPVVCENYHRLFDGRTRMERGTLTLRVLSPIPTEGLTADDVTSLTESTHSTMLATLIEISQPASITTQANTDSKLDTSEPSIRIQTLNNEETEIDANDDGVDTPTSAAWSHSGESFGTQTTEDEMDSEEDAVLMKRPKASAEKEETMAAPSEGLDASGAPSEEVGDRA